MQLSYIYLIQMEGFNFFDDDLFESKNVSNLSVTSYEALCCEPGWFFSDGVEDKTNSLMIHKHKADYLYLKKFFVEAIESYESYLTNCTNISVTSKRECLEGIARGYLKSNGFCIGLKYAKDLHKLSSTFDSFTASLTLLSDSLERCHFYKDQVLVCQKLCQLHITNSDMWLKLTFAYGLYFNIPLPAVRSLCSNSNPVELLCNSHSFNNKCSCNTALRESSSYGDANETYIILVCLLHCLFHLNSVESSAVGFASTQIQTYTKAINQELDNLQIALHYDDKRIDELKLTVKQLHTGLILDVNGSAEITDRSQTKYFTSDQVLLAVNDGNTSDFEEKWLATQLFKRFS